jgi:hypothetical protein
MFAVVVYQDGLEEMQRNKEPIGRPRQIALVHD